MNPGGKSSLFIAAAAAEIDSNTNRCSSRRKDALNKEEKEQELYSLLISAFSCCSSRHK